MRSLGWEGSSVPRRHPIPQRVVWADAEAKNRTFISWFVPLKRGMASNLTVGFLGAGKMATALAKGFVRSGLVTADQVLASDVQEGARAVFTQEVGAKTTNSSPEVARFAHLLILAVKPAQATEALAEVSGYFTEEHLLVSIAAGVTLNTLAGELYEGARLVRVMPNTPALIGASATGYALGEYARPEDAQIVQTLFGSVGVAFEVKEPLLDAVTGLSGSGPAYAYLMIEALSDGGVAAGLPRDIATRLAAQTLLGGARMVLETGMHPGPLKDMVTSPGGTTIEGVHELEKGGVRAALMNAVRAAAAKAKALGKT
jgi:pyrroline-5-carboxylate reductase